MGGGTVTTINPAYSEKPVRVGTWIDGSPVYRVAINRKLTALEKADKGASLLNISVDRSKVIILNHFAAVSDTGDYAAWDFGQSITWDGLEYATWDMPEAQVITGWVEYVQRQ